MAPGSLKKKKIPPKVPQTGLALLDCITVPSLTKVVFPPVSVLTLVPEIVTVPVFVMLPCNMLPFHWRRLGGQATTKAGLAKSVPLCSQAWPEPLPVISPDHVGALPPVRSNTAPAATLKTPLELVPPP